MKKILLYLFRNRTKIVDGLALAVALLEYIPKANKSRRPRRK